MKKGLSSTTFPKRNGAGFTLLETIIAIFIITIGIVGVSSLVSQTIGSVTISSQRLIAAYLAQEGIEIVRNIRDTNWLEDVAWDEGLGVGDWEGDYTDTQSFFYPCSPIPFTCPTRGFPLHSLKINGGFYNYSSGTDTEFQRRITIFDKTADMFKVSVSVGWRAKGKTYQIEAQENLYNWR
ncbi:prepilin-type N-terminal cleavage/methylation domain-containing protein [Patescibacteria group bacterium]|nr:prepilin-type N-terminal cleavage/methylation domain-containing protein [Patescibacteria group bacterium]